MANQTPEKFSTSETAMDSIEMAQYVTQTGSGTKKREIYEMYSRAVENQPGSETPTKSSSEKSTRLKKY